MEISIKTNFPEVQRQLTALGRQMPFALSLALNKTAEWVETDVRRAMRTSFDRPTPFFLRSLRIVRSTKTKLEAKVWFKDRGLGDNASKVALPHIEGGKRGFKQFEARLRAIGAIPAGWYAVPGKGAKLNAYGNMSPGQLSLLLNYVGAYREAGFNTIQSKDRLKLKRKKGVQYFIAKPGNAQRLLPGIYKKTTTGFGTALQSMVIFVRNARYKRRFDFYGVGAKTLAFRFPLEAQKAIDRAIRTAR